MHACLHLKKFCRERIACIFKIPDRSVKLQKLIKRKKVEHKSVGCSQTEWEWIVVDEQTGNLNLKFRNEDWVSG